MQDAVNEQWYYGGPNDTFEGMLIFAGIFFFYVAVIQICIWICNNEKSAKTIINALTHGLNILLIVFILLHNPFKSFNSFLGLIGMSIVTTFLAFMFNSVCRTVVFEGIKKKQRAKIQNDL